VAVTQTQACHKYVDRPQKAVVMFLPLVEVCEAEGKGGRSQCLALPPLGMFVIWVEDLKMVLDLEPRAQASSILRKTEE
jgi:hypothetical protein